MLFNKVNYGSMRGLFNDPSYVMGDYLIRSYFISKSATNELNAIDISESDLKALFGKNADKSQITNYYPYIKQNYAGKFWLNSDELQHLLYQNNKKETLLVALVLIFIFTLMIFDLFFVSLF